MSATRKKVRNGIAYVLAYAFYLYGRAIEHKAKLQAFEKNKKRRYFDDASLARFIASINELERLQGGQHVVKERKVATTNDEAGARAALRATLIDVRDDVKLYGEEGSEAPRLFGVGQAIDDSSPHLLSVAANVLAAWEQPEAKAAALAAGVTGERIAVVITQRDALKAAYEQHTVVRAAGVTRTAGKTMTHLQIQATSARIRQVARRVFREQPEILAQFLTVPAGAIAKSRAAVTAPAAPAPAANQLAASTSIEKPGAAGAEVLVPARAPVAEVAASGVASSEDRAKTESVAAAAAERAAPRARRSRRQRQELGRSTRGASSQSDEAKSGHSESSGDNGVHAKNGLAKRRSHTSL